MRKILTIQNASAITLAYLNNLESGTCHEVINGEYTLNFVVLIEPLKAEYLYDRNNIIIYNNDYFRVINIEELHNEDNMLKASVVAEHISYDLIGEERESFIENDRAAIWVMNAALSGTGFEFTGTDVMTTASIELQGTEEEPINIRNVLFNIASIWSGELEYFRNQVSLKKQLGQNRGVDFRFGKNLQEVKRIIDYSTDPISISYDVTVVQGSELEELGYFALGDTVRVIDDALDIDHYSRIVEVEKDIITGINSKVVLGQPIADLNNSMVRLSKSVKEVDNKLSAVVDEHGNLIASKIKGTLSDAIEVVTNSTAYITFDNLIGIIIHNQPLESESTWAMKLSSGGLLISNAKDVQGKWIWRTAITGESISANAITTGTLTAININGVVITGSTVISDSADAEIKLDNGILSIKKKSSNQQFKMNYRAGLPVNILQSELEYYNEFKASNPNKPASNTISLNSQNSHMGLEFGNGAVSLGNNWVNIGMYGGTFDWSKVHEGTNAPANAQGAKLLIDLATTWWQPNPGVEFYIPSSEVQINAGTFNLLGNLVARGNISNIPGFYYNGVSCTVGSGAMSVSLPGISSSDFSTRVSGSFSVGGFKNCVIDTEEYGELFFSAYETAEIYLGDIGEAEIINNECVIQLDERLLACVNTEMPYQVFLQKYGPGDIWVEQRNIDNFVVKGDNIRFCWEVKAKRKTGENIRFGQPR